jgi:hypothetical protein
MKIEQVKLDALIPYARNSRTHDDAQVAQIAASIKEFGWTNPILLDGENGIIAGHGRVMAAQKLGEIKVPTIELAHMTDIQKQAYIIADNKLALNAGWDNQMLALEIKDLKEANFDIGILGFDKSELKDLFADEKEEEKNAYTQNIAAPVYEPSEDKPDISDLYNDQKAMNLIFSIKESKLSEKEKQFLMTAASRHIVFDYAKIANFYAHSSKECQELMEKSALIIIDFDKAIENGFVKLTQEINDMFQLDEYDEDE